MKWLENLQASELTRVSSTDLKLIAERAAEAASLAADLKQPVQSCYWRLALLCTYERVKRERRARSKCGTQTQAAWA
jgi:hypothetical protein